MTSLYVESLNYSYELPQASIEVLRNITFNVGPGQITTLLGPSGCGKSTLLKLVAGLITSPYAAIRIDEWTPADLKLKKGFGFAFQEPALLPWRTVAQNILLPSEIGPKTVDQTRAQGRLNELLELMGLKPFSHYYPDQLSGGMKQRVALARTLLLDPTVLLLDEPLASLDLLTRTRLMVELSKILANLECPTVIVTHSVDEAVFWGSEVVLLSPRPGRIVKKLQNPEPFPRNIQHLESEVFHSLSAKCREILFGYEMV